MSVQFHLLLGKEEEEEEVLEVLGREGGDPRRENMGNCLGGKSKLVFFSTLPFISSSNCGKKGGEAEKV